MAVDYTPQLHESRKLVDSIEEQPSYVSTPNPPIKVPLVGQVINLQTPELNTIVKDMGHVTMDFFCVDDS